MRNAPSTAKQDPPLVRSKKNLSFPFLSFFLFIQKYLLLNGDARSRSFQPQSRPKSQRLVDLNGKRVASVRGHWLIAVPRPVWPVSTIFSFSLFGLFYLIYLIYLIRCDQPSTPAASLAALVAVGSFYHTPHSNYNQLIVTRVPSRVAG